MTGTLIRFVSIFMVSMGSCDCAPAVAVASISETASSARRAPDRRRRARTERAMVRKFLRTSGVPILEQVRFSSIGDAGLDARKGWLVCFLGLIKRAFRI